MEHGFSTEVLETGIIGWDWACLQLFDVTKIMMFLLRTEKGGLHAASSGTYINAGGITHSLTNEEINVEILDTWRSKQSKACYPARWRVRIAPLSIDVKITSNLPDQEMRTLGSTGVTYWEGSVSIEGIKV
jgi:predicted secreted hydrolase